MELPLAQAPFLAGILLSWSLAAPPGPANALIAHVAAQRSFGAGWVTGLGAVAGDLVIFLLMGFGVLRLLDAFPWAKVVLALAGGALMAYFAIEAWRSARRIHARPGEVASAEAAAPDVTARGGFARSFVAMLTSPYNWGWWLSAGSAMFAALGWGIVAGFFAGLIAWAAFWSGLARVGATRVPRLREAIAYASAVVLVAFAIIVALAGVNIARTLMA